MDQPDQLCEHFKMQRALSQRFGVSTERMDAKEKTKGILKDSKHI